MSLVKSVITQPFDVDAQRFIFAAGLTRFVDKRAITYLVQGFKQNGLWAKMAAIYPFVGGNVWSCKFNLKNPIDSNLAYRITYTASPTITYNGIDFNGSTQFANTNLTPSTESIISLNSAHLSYYSRENVASGGVDIGSVTTAPSTSRFYFGIQSLHYSINASAVTTFSNVNTSGLFTVSRTAAAVTAEYKNGASVSTSTDASTIVTNVPIYLGARDVNNAADSFGLRQCAFASVGSGLTAADAFNMYNIVQQFQIILNRAV